MIRLNREEVAALSRSQIATGSQKHCNPRYPSSAFTEYGAIMAAAVLNSSRAVEMGIYVVRAFVQLRALLASNKLLAKQINKLERKIASHDIAVADILKTIRELMNPAFKQSRPIGFTANLDEDR